MKRRINRRRQGDIGELSAIEWLTRNDALVWTPVGHSPDVDLIAEFPDQLLKVQVKTSTARLTTPNGHLRWQVQVATLGGNQSWTGTVKLLDPTRIDFLFVVVGDGRRWFIPASALEARTAVQLGGPKYSEFEIERGPSLDAVVYGTDRGASTIVGPARGSAGVGEPGGPVKALATPEGVRIPPPPLFDPDDL